MIASWHGPRGFFDLTNHGGEPRCRPWRSAVFVETMARAAIWCLGVTGAARPMKMGNIASPWRYEAAAAQAIRFANIRRSRFLTPLEACSWNMPLDPRRRRKRK
jgi:hypothetical protein